MTTKAKIESLLFISGQPVSIEKIAKILEIKKREAEIVLKELIDDYKKNNHGIQIAVLGDKYQIVTHPENSSLIERFLKEEVAGELTRPQLEALTIIAYRGPVSKIELEQIRGVNCSLILRNLMIRGLIEHKAGKDGLERYIITHDFLKYLGVAAVKDLPDYERLNANRIVEELLERTKRTT